MRASGKLDSLVLYLPPSPLPRICQSPYSWGLERVGLSMRAMIANAFSLQNLLAQSISYHLSSFLVRVLLIPQST